MKRFYFGCIGEAGHYLFDVDRSCIYSRRLPSLGLPWTIEELDSGLCPRGAQELGHARLTHKDGWTALAFWDRSIDSRPGSHSTFLLEGTLDFTAAIEAARASFPQVFERYRFHIMEVPR